MRNHILIKSLMLAVFASVALPMGEAFAGCIKWSDARAVIAKNHLKKPGDVRRRAIGRGGEVISIKLCKKGGSYIYRLTVINRKKRVRDVVIDAGRGSSSRRSRKRGSKLEGRIINRVKRNLRRHGINYY